MKAAVLGRIFVFILFVANHAVLCSALVRVCVYPSVFRFFKGRGRSSMGLSKFEAANRNCVRVLVFGGRLFRVVVAVVAVVGVVGVIGVSCPLCAGALALTGQFERRQYTSGKK